MRRTGMGWWVAGLGLSLAGCAISPITVIGSASPRSETQAEAPKPTPAVMQLAVYGTQAADDGQQELVQALREIEGTALFFDTGQAELSKEGRVKLLRVAEVLKRYPDLKVRVEGNADERGTAQLNHDLAFRRARAARDYLVSVQVDPGQVLMVSYGADKPLSPGKGEEHWQVNRRDDINLVQQKK